MSLENVLLLLIIVATVTTGDEEDIMLLSKAETAEGGVEVEEENVHDQVGGADDGDVGEAWGRDTGVRSDR